MLMLSLAPVIAALVAWIFLGEILTSGQIVGILLTIAGISWVVLERNGNPDDNALMMECALYQRNAAGDGFTREAHLGGISYADLAQQGGGVHRYELASAVSLPMGQHFIAVLYKYAGVDGYLTGACSAAGAVFPGAGYYRDGTAVDLPSSLPDTDQSAPADQLVWLELSAE